LPEVSRSPRAALCLLALALCARAFDFAALKPQGYLSDFAGVVDSEQRARLEQYCARLEKAAGVQLALVTLPSLEGEPIEDVANALFRAWGVGRKQTHEGVLLLLAIRDRRSRLEVGYGLEPILPDGFAGSILRSMRPALREQRYGEALLAAAAQIGARIAEAKGVPLDSPQPPPARSQPADSIGLWLLLAIPLFLALSVLGGLIQGRRRLGRSSGAGDLLTGLLVGSLMGRSIGYRSRGGGGFGGFDSGDSFGGFGGGDSGGGGASSSW
jgi:uncharacterized protein